MDFDALFFLCITIALRHLERAWPTHLQIFTTEIVQGCV